MPEYVPSNPPAPMVGRSEEWRTLSDFVHSGTDHATLGIVWGRRRIGKSYLLSQLASSDGLYYEAVQGSASESLAELGVAVGRMLSAPAPLDFPTWDTALAALMQLGMDREFTVVLDEYPYLQEQSPELDAIIQRAFGPNSELRRDTRCRLILCGSAMSTMSQLLTGSAPLRGRAGLDLRMTPFDFRDALELFGTDDLVLATRLYSIIGGVAAYARDMVDDHLPSTIDDLPDWVARRVLSPAAPLSREVELLLSEDPKTAKARKLNLYHATLAATALGRTTPARISDYVKVSGPALDPILRGLVEAGFIERLADPIRDRRPTYHPGDSILRFHYAVLRPNHTRLGRHGTDLRRLWDDVQPSFRSNVVGPTFELMARHWINHYANIEAMRSGAIHVGPSSVVVNGTEREVDFIAALDDSDHAADRTITAIGEAKSGETISSAHLNRLRSIRSALGTRASDAQLVLVGPRFSDTLTAEGAASSDIELVDLERLYYGS